MKRRLSRLLAALAAGMAATALLTGAVPLPDPAAAVDGIDETLGAWTIAVVAGLAFAETGAFVGRRPGRDRRHRRRRRRWAGD
ncbi:MAG: hypothetical protein M3R12_09700, partial [Actinomycetota bacterium]|nr:hypothetical protein [Actinomycetota bacterium]